MIPCFAPPPPSHLVARWGGAGGGVLRWSPKIFGEADGFGSVPKLAEAQILKQISDLVTKSGGVGYRREKFFSEQMGTQIHDFVIIKACCRNYEFVKSLFGSSILIIVSNSETLSICA